MESAKDQEDIFHCNILNPKEKLAWSLFKCFFLSKNTNYTRQWLVVIKWIANAVSWLTVKQAELCSLIRWGNRHQMNL